MSDTPETDAKSFIAFDTEGRKLVVVLATTSESFERERDEAMRQLDNLKASSIHSCHDQCQRPMCVLRRERDEARAAFVIATDQMVIAQGKVREAHDRVIGDLERADVMAEKAKELIARWDQPSWKDTAPTAGFIYALRDAVEAYEKTTK